MEEDVKSLVSRVAKLEDSMRMLVLLTEKQKKELDRLRSQNDDDEKTVQIVAEVQGQLDLIEERSIRRTINAKAHAKESAAEGGEISIVSLHDSEGMLPDDFPSTLKLFREMEMLNVHDLLTFYEQDHLQKEDDTDEVLKDRLARFLGLA